MDNTKLISIQKNKILIILRDIIHKYITLYNSIIDIYNKEDISIDDKKNKKNIEEILSTIENKYKFKEKIDESIEEIEKGYDNIKKSVRIYYLLDKEDILELKNINIYSISKIVFNIIILKLTEIILNIKEIINNIKSIIPSDLLININNDLFDNFNKEYNLLLEYDRNFILKKCEEYKKNIGVGKQSFAPLKKYNAIIYLYYCRLNKIVKTLFIKVLTGEFVYLNIIKLWREDITNLYRILDPRLINIKISKCIDRLKRKIGLLIDKIENNIRINCGIDNIIQYILPCLFNIKKIDTIDNISSELNNNSVNTIVIYNTNKDIFINYNDITNPDIEKLEYKNYKYLIHSRFNSKNISKGKIQLVKDSLMNIKKKFNQINEKGITENNNTLDIMFDIYKKSNNNKNDKNIEFIPSSTNESFVLLFHIKDNKYGLISDKNDNIIFTKLSDVPGIIHIIDLLKLIVTSESINKMIEKYDKEKLINKKKKIFEREVIKLNNINNKYINGLNLILDENKLQNKLFKFNLKKLNLNKTNLNLLHQGNLDLLEKNLKSLNIWFNIKDILNNLNGLSNKEKIEKLNENKLELLDKIILIYNKKMKNISNNNYVQYYKLQKYIPIINKDIVSQTFIYLGSYNNIGVGDFRFAKTKQSFAPLKNKVKIYIQYIIDKLLTQKIIIDKIENKNIMEKYIVKVIINIITECITNIKILENISI
jgi:hypothetical protein